MVRSQSARHKKGADSLLASGECDRIFQYFFGGWMQKRFVFPKNEGEETRGGRELISYRKYLCFEFREKESVKNITNHVEMILGESGIKEGMIIVSPMHTTSAVFINDDEEGLISDTMEFLQTLVPEYKTPYYLHNRSDKDAPAHLKRNILGRSEVISVTDGRMDLGNWEQIFYADFYGNRKKKICVKVLGE